MSIDYSLYLVTDRAILNGKDILKAVEDSIRGGATVIQLREKNISSLDFYKLAMEMKKITKHYNIPLIINDRLDIALAVDADGLHIGQQDLPIDAARRILGSNKILGYSVGSVEEAIYGEQKGADYLGAGPVFPTGSKADAAEPIGIKALAEIKKSVSIPVVGIGGIGMSNIDEVKASGIDGISVISAILGSDDIEEATKSNKSLEESMNKVFFVDFDGTITKVDTCTAMTKAFAKGSYEKANKLWEDKKITTEECANMIFSCFDADLSDIKQLMYTIEIDEYFKEFLSKCREFGYKVYILSDGYDFNIKTILDRYNIDVEYYANKLLYDDENGFSIRCTYQDASCGSCGTCKTSLIEKLKGESDIVIYIGDGYSDTCPARMADKVYAKGILYKYCLDNGISASNFSNFKDIILEELSE